MLNFKYASLCFSFSCITNVVYGPQTKLFIFKIFTKQMIRVVCNKWYRLAADYNSFKVPFDFCQSKFFTEKSTIYIKINIHKPLRIKTNNKAHTVHFLHVSSTEDISAYMVSGTTARTEFVSARCYNNRAIVPLLTVEQLFL